MRLLLALFRIPVRMRRPSAAREALGLRPLMKAGRAYAARIKGVPLMAAGAEPFVFFSRRPATQRAPDAWVRGIVTLVFLKLAIHDNGIISFETHAQLL